MQAMTSTTTGRTRSMTLPLERILVGVSIGIGTRFGGEQVALEGVAFMDGHGAEVGLGDGQGDHHEDGQQGIEVIRNGRR